MKNTITTIPKGATQVAKTKDLKGFMARADGRRNLECFFDTLADNGVNVSMYDPDEFAADSNDLECNLWELGCNLIWFGNWMQAKIKAFKTLRKMSFFEIAEVADLTGTVSQACGSSVVVGEWCRSEGVVYVMHNGVCDASGASDEQRKRDRDRSDEACALYLFEGLIEDWAGEQVA